MIQLQLQPEIEAQLAAEAAARGLSLDGFIEAIVTDYTREATDLSSCQQLDEQQLADDLREGLRDIAEGRTRPAEDVFADLHRRYDIQG